MANNKNGVSRRTILGGGAAALAAVGLSSRASAQGQIPPEAVMYVAKTENPDQFCANCMQWQGTPVAQYSDLNEGDPEMAACAIVAGQLASTGWCGVWAPLPS